MYTIEFIRRNTMKFCWRLLYTLLFVLVLAACNQSHNEQISEPQNTQSETPSTNEDDEQKDDGEENSEEDSEEKPEEKVNDELAPDSREPKYKVTEHWSIQPISEDVNEQVVLLTIDDAPERYAVDMAQTLKELDAPAIFFVNGHFLESKEDKQKLKDIYDMGFAIGNHTYSHANLREISEEEQREEIIRVNDMVEEVIGEQPLFFRSPYGANTDYAFDLVKELGMTIMNWTYGYDWEPEYQTKESITEIMIHAEELGNGANLLMHDRKWTAEALKDIVIGLREQGYDLVDPHLIERPNN